MITILCIFSNAQNSFNITNYDYFVSAAQNIEIFEEGYVVVGGGKESLSGKYKILVKQFDSFGNPTISKFFGDTIYDWYHGIENSLFKTLDGGYAIGGSKNNSNSNAALLVRFDENFDTLWTKTYLEGTHFIATYQCKQTPDSGFVLVGYTDYGNAQYDYDALLIKTDSLGNMQWYKKYGHAGGYDKTYIVENAYDGGFCLAGASNIDGVDKWYLIKTDSLGNQQWYRTYGSELGEGKINGFTYTKDSCIIISGGYTMNIIGYYAYGLNRIVKIDTLGNTIWDKKFGPVLEYYYFTSVLEKENGDIAVMRLHGETNKVKNDIYMLNSDGDFLWKRSFRQFPSSSSYDEYLNTIISTPDQGFAMAGWGYSSSASPTQQMWVVKADSLGCDGTGNCNDTALMLVSYPDTVCYYGDTTQLLLHIQGVSAPYSIYLDGVLAADSVFYPSVYSNVIEVPMCFTPPFVNSDQLVLVTITDGFGHSVIENITFYVKDCDLGVEEVFSGRLQIYPNPANTMIRIVASGNIYYSALEDKIENIQIFDIQGKKLKDMRGFDITNAIDISCLSEGVYFIIVTNKNVVYKEKFVKSE